MLVDQQGSLGSDEAGRFRAKMGIDWKLKPIDLHAPIVKRHNALVRRVLHNIEGRTTLEALSETDEIK